MDNIITELNPSEIEYISGGEGMEGTGITAQNQGADGVETVAVNDGGTGAAIRDILGDG